MTPDLNQRSDREGHFEFRERWQDALKFCENELGSEDFAHIETYESPEQMLSAIDALQKQAYEGSVPRLLRQFKPRLLSVRDFALGVISTIGSFRMASVWGLMTLMLELAIRSDAMLQEVTAMWADVSTSLQMFESYQTFIEKDEMLQEAQFEILVELLFFAALTIKTVKDTRVIGTNVLTGLGHWTPLKLKFNETSEKISKRIHFIKQRSEAEVLRIQMEQTTESMKHFEIPGQDRLRSISNASADEIANVPCYYVPFPVNPNFYGRKQILQDLKDEFEPTQVAASPTKMKSVALWASAGIGKTQIALAYADQQRGLGLNAIFWIRCENELESAKCFTEVATLLNLPGATGSVGHIQNRLIVRQWLQQTSTPWLLIFDNLESMSLLSDVMPSCGHGSILITCRSELLAASAASISIEVPPFSGSDGGRMLLSELGKSRDSKSESDLAERISRELGGHALTIDVVARYMRSRRKTLAEVASVLEAVPAPWKKKNRRGITNPYYNDNYDTAWVLAFGQLEPSTSRLYGIVCMLGPDDIPLEAFVHLEKPRDDAGIESDDLEDIVLELRDLALAKVDNTQQMLSVHRFLSAAFREYMKPKDRLLRWADAAGTLHATFPQQNAGWMLHNKWKICEGLIDHVSFLCQRYRELAETHSPPPYNGDFTYLTANASRYLFEIGRYNAAIDICGAGFQHCTNQELLEYSNLCVNYESILCERGQDKAALPYCERVYEIRKALLEPGHGEIANALSNWALSIVGTGKNLDDGLSKLLEALRMDLAGPADHARRVQHLRHYNLGFAYRAMGKTQESKEQVRLATECVMAEFGPKSRYLNITYRMESAFACEDADYPTAYRLLEQSLEIASEPNGTNAWVSASLYKMGEIRLRQQRPAEAENLLRRAEFITRLNEREKGDAGDTARVLNLLAQALAAQSRLTESLRLRQEADLLYSKLMETGEYTRSANPDLKWDYLVCLKFR